jgi:hypothetical protein
MAKSRSPTAILNLWCVGGVAVCDLVGECIGEVVFERVVECFNFA